MKRLFVARLLVAMLLSFLFSLLLFITLMSGSFFLGYRRSIVGWGREKLGSAEGELVKVLTELLPLLDAHGRSQEVIALLEERIDSIVPPGILVTVYDERQRVLSTRGRQHMMGRGMMRGGGGRGMAPDQLPLRRVELGGKLLGYYRIGTPGFGTDRANARFLSSMRKTTWISIAFALPLAFLSALLLSRRVTLSARKVAGGIQEMARGNVGVKIPEDGAEEIVAIARAANELAGKLEKEESIRRQWAADVAHDLRTPIAALKAQFEGMRDGVLEANSVRIGRTLQELSRIEALVDDLAELSRLESPEMKISPAPIDLARFCEELKSRFEPDFRVKGISVEWECAVPVIVADENLLLRALSNLLSNAVRHTPEGGRIALSFSEEKDSFAIKVFNTGEAIPQEEIVRLFQRLYRGEYARKSLGSGLGLTITLKIAELHGGTITVESKKGHGTTVRMEIVNLDTAVDKPRR